MAWLRSLKGNLGQSRRLLNGDEPDLAVLSGLPMRWIALEGVDGGSGRKMCEGSGITQSTPTLTNPKP